MFHLKVKFAFHTSAMCASNTMLQSIPARLMEAGCRSCSQSSISLPCISFHLDEIQKAFPIFMRGSPESYEPQHFFLLGTISYAATDSGSCSLSNFWCFRRMRWKQGSSNDNA